MTKTVKKVVSLLLMMSILIGLCTTSMAVDYGATMNLKATSTTPKVGDTISITLSLASVTNVQGVATVHAKINYDKTILQLTKYEAVNSWSAPIYNEENQEFVTERSDVMPAGGDIIKLDFKVLAVPTNNETMVSITEFDVADTENQIIVSDVSLKLNITAKEEKPDEKPDENPDNKPDDGGNQKPNTDDNKEDNSNKDDNQGNSNNSNKKDDTTSDEKMPQTGVSIILPVSIIFVLLLAIVLYKKMKKNNDI